MTTYCFGTAEFVKSLEKAAAGDVVILASRHTLTWGLPRERETSKQRVKRIEEDGMNLKVTKR